MSEADQGPVAHGIEVSAQDARLDARALLEAALAIVAEEGLGGLTLRPLAKRFGASVASLTRQVGSKGQLVDYLIGLAARADQEELGSWLRLVESFDTLPRETLIAITEDMLRVRSESGRRRTHFKCELIQAAAFNAQLRPALTAWIAIDRRFWEALVRASGLTMTFDMVAALDAFAIDDAARALTVDAYDPYCWIRREGIRRLWHGLFAGEPTTPNPLFERALSEQSPSRRHPLWSVRTLLGERDRAYGAIVASIILDAGTDAITHREVARRAGAPHTSIAYHYPLQDDLVEIGMQAIIEMVEKGTREAMDGRELPVEAGQLAFASFAIALAAARRPNLRPIVREMRRRRGQHLLAWFQKQVPDKPNVDIANAQTMASVLIGAAVLARASIGSAPLAKPIFGQLGDWPDVLARFRWLPAGKGMDQPLNESHAGRSSR